MKENNNTKFNLMKVNESSPNHKQHNEISKKEVSNDFHQANLTNESKDELIKQLIQQNYEILKESQQQRILIQSEFKQINDIQNLNVLIGQLVKYI